MNKRKLDNSGFTVVELVVSFSITLIVILLLFQIVLNLKDLYTRDGVKTELLIKQGLMVKSLADSFEKQEVKSVAKCTEANCLKFTFIDNTTKDLKISPNMFQYGDYKTKLVDGSEFGTFTVNKGTYTSTDVNSKNSVLSIKVDISNSLVEGDYGVQIVYLYNSNKTAVGDVTINSVIK